MAEFPALTLWTDAYLADTRHLSTIEHGAYMLLLIEAWRRPHCDLPDDDQILARLAGLSMEEWGAIRDTILAFWKRDGRSKTLTQKRLMFERDRARVRSKSGKDNSAKRWNKTQKADATAMQTGCQIDATTATATATVEEEESSPLEPTLDARENSNGKRGPYAFHGKTIKLNQADLDGWREAFHGIPDIVAELHALDAWFQGDRVSDAKRKDWFNAVPGMLSRKHQEAVAAAAKASEWTFDSPV